MTTPTNEARVLELQTLFSEAIAYGAVYFPAIAKEQWDEMRDDKARQLAIRSLAASATQVPQGWKLVPVEADDTMKQAGIDVAPSGLLEIRGQLRNRASWSTEECAEVYRAMIEKSPPAPQAATQGEAVAWESLFGRKGPRLVEPEHGAEPSLRAVLRAYYFSSGMPAKRAHKLADDYIAAWCAEIRGLAVINEPAPAPSKDHNHG